MNINRHNYEEFFLLYLDNELSGEDRRRVEQFVQLHPDLQEELEMLQQTRLVADPSVVFSGKQTLLKSSADCDINLHNYEQWLLLYVDNELNTGQEIAVENFAIAHPAIKTELDILQKTKLQPDESILYFNKESLYRKEEKERRVIPMRWWRIAAAAMVFLAIGTGAFFLLDQPAKPDAPIVEATPKQPAVNDPVSAPKEEVNSNQETVTSPADQSIEKSGQQLPIPMEERNLVRKNTNQVKAEQQKQVVDPSTTDNTTPDVAVIDDRRNINSDLEDPTTVSLTTPSKDALTNLKENNVTLAVTNSNHPALEPIQTTDDEPAFASEKKSKFRGFLRKITRTFEKTTSIKATDDDDRLLVGGLAIQL